MHDHCLEESIGRVGGTVVKHTGDGVLAVFDEAGAALAAAVAEQRGGDYFGTTLNRAARLLGVAHATEVLCSDAAAESAVDTLPDGMELVDLGEHRLRDLERAVQVFQVVAPTFVGRDAAIESLGTAVDEHPLVTLTGVGGAGKTRLALEFAARRVDTFPDGVFLVDLSTVSADPAVVGACADTLELPAAPGGRSERAQVLAALQGPLDSGQMMLADPHVVEVLQRATDTEELPDGIPLAIAWAWRALSESTLVATEPAEPPRAAPRNGGAAPFAQGSNESAYDLEGARRRLLLTIVQSAPTTATPARPLNRSGGALATPSIRSGRVRRVEPCDISAVSRRAFRRVRLLRRVRSDLSGLTCSSGLRVSCLLPFRWRGFPGRS